MNLIYFRFIWPLSVAKEWFLNLTMQFKGIVMIFFTSNINIENKQLKITHIKELMQFYSYWDILCLFAWTLEIKGQ